MEAKTFRKIIHDAVSITVEDSDMLLVDALWLQRRFKVGELKKILKHCRQYGYPTHISQNKRGLSVDLFSIFNGDTELSQNTTPSFSPPSSLCPRDPPHSSPSPALNTLNQSDRTPFSNNIMLPSTSNTSVPLSVLPQQPSAVPLPPTHPQPIASANSANSHPAATNATGVNASLNLHRDLYDELLSWGCFSSSEILAAVHKRVTHDLAITQDYIVNDLLGAPPLEQQQLTEEERENEERKIQLQFEQDMDKAILNSEEGRDHIQACKKRRTTELRTDHSCSIADACEFQRSYLLGKRQAERNTESSQPKECVIRVIVSLLDSMSGLFGINSSHSNSGISDCSRSRCDGAADNSSSSSSSSSGGSSGSSSGGSSGSGSGSGSGSDNSGRGVGGSEGVPNKVALHEVREVTVSLLDLEAKSYKWYNDSALGYFIDMQERIAHTSGVESIEVFLKRLNAFVHCPPHVQSKVATGGVSGQKVETNGRDDECNESVRSVLECLRSQVNRLNGDLYTLSSSTSGVPQAFLDCDPDQKHLAKYSMDDDGFEIL